LYTRVTQVLQLLYEVEDRLWEFLGDPSQWQSVYVDYHPPFVERLWRQYGDNRIYLHRIHPCRPEEALFHPHPWPSAMRVCDGSYEMAVGYSSETEAPPVVAKETLVGGFAYEMTDENAWHSVRPLGRPSMSLMVTGKPWSRSSPKSGKSLLPFTEKQSKRLFAFFREYYE